MFGGVEDRCLAEQLSNRVLFGILTARTKRECICLDMYATKYLEILFVKFFGKADTRVSVQKANTIEENSCCRWWVIHRHNWTRFVSTPGGSPQPETGVLVVRIHVLLDAMIANFSSRWTFVFEDIEDEKDSDHES